MKRDACYKNAANRKKSDGYLMRGVKELKGNFNKLPKGTLIKSDYSFIYRL